MSTTAWKPTGGTEDFAMKDKAVGMEEWYGRPSTSSTLSCLPGDSPIPAPASGKFIQSSAATTIEEKFSDAAQVHVVYGACPTLALHVQWDLPQGLKDVPEVEEAGKTLCYSPWIDQPEYLQNQEYKYGSVGNPDPSIRRLAIATFSNVLRSLAPWVRGMSRRGLPMVRIIRAHKISESESAILRKVSEEIIRP